MKKFLLFLSLILWVGLECRVYADDTYALVTKVSELTQDSKVIIVGKKDGTTYAAAPSTSGNIAATTVSIKEDGTITLKTDQKAVQVFNIVVSSTSSTSIAFKQAEGGKYVIVNTGNTNSSYGTSCQYNDVSIAPSGSVATVKYTSSSKSRMLRLYASKPDFRSYSDTKSGQDIYIYKLKEADTPKALGDLAVTYGDNQSVADDGSATVPEGTVFNFKAENATSLKVTDVEDNVIAQGTDAATWTATEGENIITATAVGVDASGAPATKTVMFQVNVKGIEPEAVVITPAPANDEITVARGSVVKFYSKNATSLKIENEDGETIVPGDTYDLTVNKEQTVSVTPIKGEKEYTDLGVIVAIKLETAPLCGQVVFSPAAGEVEAGTVVTISAPNAKSYLYSVSGTELNGELVQGDSFTYTVSSPCTITVTPYNADEVAGTETSAAYTIKKVQGWIRVTKDSQLIPGNKYVFISKPLTSGKVQYGPMVLANAKSTNKGFDGVFVDDNDKNSTQLKDTYTSLPASATIFILEGNSEAWYLKNGDSYLNGNTVKEMKLDAKSAVKITTSENNTIVKFSNNSYVQATVQNGSNNTQGSSTFNNYSTDQKPVFLYTQAVEKPELGEPVFVPADNSGIESGTEVTVTIPNSEVVIVTPYLIDGSLGTSVSNPGQTATFTVNKWHRRFLVQGSLDDNLGEEKEAFYFLTGSEACDYPITVNHGTYEPWEEHQPAAAPAREAAATGSAEMDAQTSDEGTTITYTAHLNNMAGLFSLNLEGENGSLMGHRTDAVACDETCTEHPKHVYVQPGQSYNLVHSANENAVQLSTIDLHNVYGNGYKTADLTVTLDPFRSATMSLAGDSQELTGVTDVAVDNAAAPVEYYDLQGRRIDAPAAGSVVIRRQGADVRKIHIR